MTEPPPGPDWTAGHALLQHHANTGSVFSSNEIRDQLRALGFGRFTSGLLFRQAAEHGVIRRVGIDVSTDAPSRGAFVRRWIGTQQRTPLEALIVPARRDTTGRFTTHTFDDVPLPLEIGS